MLASLSCFCHFLQSFSIWPAIAVQEMCKNATKPLMKINDSGICNFGHLSQII